MSVNYQQFEQQKTPCLYVYCNKCGLTTKDPNKKCMNASNGDKPIKMRECKFKESHHYKVRVKTKDGEKQKQLEGSFLDVIRNSYLFRESLANPMAQNIPIPNPNINFNLVESVSMKVCFAKFMAFKHNIGVPDYQKKVVGDIYLKEIESTLLTFFKVLKKNHIDIENTPISHLNRDHLGMLSLYLREKKYKLSYYNNHYKNLRQMANFANNHLNAGLNLKFLFEHAKKTIGKKKNIKRISMDKFNQIINLAKMRVEQKKDCNILETGRYGKQWIVPAFYLCLYTGRRREEVINFKWNQIQFTEGDYYIIGNNLKSSRLSDLEEDDYQEYVVPVFPQLLTFLESIGLKKNIGKDEYILNIEDRNEITLISQKNYLSKAFQFFVKEAGLSFQLYDLKRTFLSNGYSVVGDKLYQVSDHADMKVLKNHYLNSDSAHQQFLKNMEIK